MRVRKGKNIGFGSCLHAHRREQIVERWDTRTVLPSARLSSES